MQCMAEAVPTQIEMLRVRSVLGREIRTTQAYFNRIPRYRVSDK